MLKGKQAGLDPRRPDGSFGESCLRATTALKMACLLNDACRRRARPSTWLSDWTQQELTLWAAAAALDESRPICDHKRGESHPLTKFPFSEVSCNFPELDAIW